MSKEDEIGNLVMELIIDLLAKQDRGELSGDDWRAGLSSPSPIPSWDAPRIGLRAWRQAEISHIN